METIFDSKKLELIYNGIGEDKGRTQTLSNVKQDASNEDMAAFGNLLGSLAPTEETIDSVVIVEKQRINL